MTNNKENKCWLKIFEEDDREYPIECDGCGIETNKAISGIESCCGGCVRHLCFDCIKYAYKLIEEKENGI